MELRGDDYDLRNRELLFNFDLGDIEYASPKKGSNPRVKMLLKNNQYKDHRKSLPELLPFLLTSQNEVYVCVYEDQTDTLIRQYDVLLEQLAQLPAAQTGKTQGLYRIKKNR